MSRKRLGRFGALGALAAGTGIFVALIPSTASSVRDEPPNNVLARQVAIERGEAKPTKFDKPVSGGVMNSVQAQLGDATGPVSLRTLRAQRAWERAHAEVPVPPSRFEGTGGCPNRFEGDDNDDDTNKGRIDNIRVNQDCSLRRQAEEWVGVNPRDFSNVLAGQNDSMVGFNHCGYDWSLNNGSIWGSVGTQPPPFYQELFAGTNDTADACSDPAGTFDHLGNAYVTGVFFDVADIESSIWVAKSNYPIKGRFYHEPRQLPFQEYRTAVMGEPANDNDPNIFHDKELMVGDTRPASPKKGRVYVTWTRFETNDTAPGGRSPIVFSQSKDGGATWSQAVIISGSSSIFCTDFSGTPGNPNACDQDQGSHPVVGRDGTIYVIFGNGNTPEPGVNQVLAVRCPVTNDCESEADWEGPFLLGPLIGTHPVGQPGNPEGCPVGRQCLPPNGYRIPEFTSMSISVDQAGRLYATWADHTEGKAPCLGTLPPAQPPCDHEVWFSFSTDRGTNWHRRINVTDTLGNNAQYMPWHDVAGDGSKVYVAFYDRHYGNCENTGCNDITLATISNPRSSDRKIKFRRITTSSMPNLLPANNPIQAGFNGDYIWLEVSHHNFDQKRVHIVWSDTRPLFGSSPEEDIYYARLGPGGNDDAGPSDD
jgi:hypothetical protein